MNEYDGVSSCENTHTALAVGAGAGTAKKMRVSTHSVTTKEHEEEDRTDLCLLKYDGCHGFRIAGRYL